MIILGLDPGLATTGYGVIEFTGNKPRLIHYGTIITLPKEPLSKRILQIHESCMSILTQYRPDTVAIESLFFSVNTKTALIVAQARGALLLSAELHKVPIYDYTPPQVKLGICGYGKATKQQIQYMTKQLLNLDHIPKPDDAADALGIAICHAHSHKINQLANRR
jgi:crossover junction endodeoxyribonuclease RuvC